MPCTSRSGGLRLLVAASLFCVSVLGHASNLLGIDGSDTYPTAGHLTILRDPDGSLDAVSAEALAPQFAPVDGGTPNLGFTQDAVWLRLGLGNLAADHRRVYLVFQYPVADSVVLSVLRTDGSIVSLQAGDSVPVSTAVVPSRNFVFPVDLDPLETVTCLLRVRSTASMCLPLAVVGERKLSGMNQRDSLVFGLLFGGMILVVLYLFASQRRQPWLTRFCAYVLAFSLHVALRGGYVRYLLGDRGYPLANLVNMTAIGLLFFTGAAFYRTFLGLRDHSRALDLIMLVLQYLALALIPLSLFPNPVLFPVSVLVNLVGPLFSVTLAAILWIRRAPNAGLFAAGWLVPHLTSVTDFLRIEGVLPYSAAEQWMLPVSLGVALVFLSLAVMRRGAHDSALARMEALTTLANRRCFDETLREEWKRAGRHSSPLSLLMIDIDDFKRYNDTKGHRAGDQCLQSVASVFAGHARRAGDLAARYGGEEFTLLLPDTPALDAQRLAELIRCAVESSSHNGGSGNAAPAESGPGDGSGVTVSIGVASRVPGRDGEPEVLVSAADSALYHAKELGKNRVIVSGD